MYSTSCIYLSVTNVVDLFELNLDIGWFYVSQFVAYDFITVKILIDVSNKTLNDCGGLPSFISINIVYN